MTEAGRDCCLVLSGGVALGSYQGGFFEAIDSRLPVGWIAGSSAGALNGALIAGTRDPVNALRDYWCTHPPWQMPPLVHRGPSRHAANWLSALQSRLLGAPRHVGIGGRTGLYDLAPTVAFLRRTVDFERLNGGERRFTVAAVDLESGDPVIFDTAKGDRLGIDHLLASCGFLPEFAPVEIDGRLLGDGGLALNAPIDPVLDEIEGEDRLVLIADLFARDGNRPASFEAALERKNGLMFANQTFQRLDLYRRQWARRGIGRPRLVYASYRPLADEAGPEAAFDFSAASAADRWREGALDGAESLRRLGAWPDGEALVVVRRQ